MTTEEKILSRAKFLSITNYPQDSRDSLKTAISDLKINEELRDTYTIFDITQEEYVESLVNKIRR